MFKTHPKGLYYVFLTEMWERFSYYGITAILILYMNKTFNLGKEGIYAIYAAYGALIYMTPLLGGLVADKIWGSYKSVCIGAWLIAIGHFVVAIKDPSFTSFYLGLGIIITGTGLFSPNINAILAKLYTDDDPRRYNGFTLAYMGRNIGTIIAPIICSWIAAIYDWHWAFIVAGLGMLIGIYVFIRGKEKFSPESLSPSSPIKLRPCVMPFCLFTAIVLITLLMHHSSIVGLLLVLSVVGMLYLLIKIAQKEEQNVQKRIHTAMLLTLFYIIFMILLQQSGGALNLFTDAFVNRTIWGITIETGMFQSVEPLALVILAPIYTLMWDRLQARKIEVKDGTKFMLALIVMSCSFILMAIAICLQGSEQKMAMSWLNISYFLQAASELFIGPIGLAMVSRLIPSKILGLYMGFWVLASAVANYIAAKIGAYITPSELSNLNNINQYQSSFLILACLGLIAAAMLASMLPKLNKAI